MKRTENLKAWHATKSVPYVLVSDIFMAISRENIIGFGDVSWPLGLQFQCISA